MTSATQGRRPDGPGWYWRVIADIGYAEPCEVVDDGGGVIMRYKLFGRTTSYRVEDDRAPELVDYIPLHPPVAAPEPDWSQAPPWANWWAVEHAYGSLGMAYWFANEPVLQYSEWSDFPGTKALYNPVDLPLGIDWRTTLTKRPEASE